MGTPQFGECGPHVAGRDGVAPEVAAPGDPPLELLAPLRHKPGPVGDLPQEGGDVVSQGARGPLRQPQRGPSVRCEDRLGRQPSHGQSRDQLPERARRSA